MSFIEHLTFDQLDIIIGKNSKLLSEFNSATFEFKFLIILFIFN